MRAGRVRAWFAAIFSLAVSSAGAATEVMTCGEIVEGGIATLVADLDCSTFTGVALTLAGARARLEMNGFTITGNPANPDLGIGLPGFALPVVLCLGHCRVVGPGTITGGGGGPTTRAVPGRPSRREASTEGRAGDGSST